MFSFHSHSGQFCMHAKGTLEQVVLSAIDRRFTTYGLSEHMPRYQPDQLYPEESHLTAQDLERMYDCFLVEASRLQEKYRDQICLLVGLETEYFGPESIAFTRQLRQPHRPNCLSLPPAATTTTATTVSTAGTLPQVQYIVGSLHHVQGIPLDFSPELYLQALETVGLGSWERLFRVYFDAQFEMLQGLQPEVVGHLDLVRIFFNTLPEASTCGHHHQVGQHEEDAQKTDTENRNRGANVLTEELWTVVRRNVDYVIGYGGLFELNSRAWKKGLSDAYPQRDILQYILSKNGRVTLSDDSHGPEDVGMFYNPELKTYLERMQVQKVHYLVPNPHIKGSDVDPTWASVETGSFQHVHVRSLPLSSLNFYSS